MTFKKFITFFALSQIILAMVSTSNSVAQLATPIVGTKYYCVTNFDGTKNLVSDPGNGGFAIANTESVINPIIASITKLNKEVTSLNSQIKKAKGSKKSLLTAKLKSSKKKLGDANKRLGVLKGCVG